jgi:hypothetical protein
MGRPRTGVVKPGKIGIRCSIKTQKEWKVLCGHFITSEDALRFYIENYDRIASIISSVPKGVGKLY